MELIDLYHLRQVNHLLNQLIQDPRFLFFKREQFHYRISPVSIQRVMQGDNYFQIEIHDTSVSFETRKISDLYLEGVRYAATIIPSCRLTFLLTSSFTHLHIISPESNRMGSPLQIRVRKWPCRHYMIIVQYATMTESHYQVELEYYRGFYDIISRQTQVPYIFPTSSF